MKLTLNNSKTKNQLAAAATCRLRDSRVRVETEKRVAETLATGNKTSAETRAETVKFQAAIDKQTADIEAQSTILVGEATSGAKKLNEQAKAEKFQLAVEAFGSGDAYNQWVFASGLPEDLKLNLVYAGPGTFWTDLKGFSEVCSAARRRRQWNPRRSITPRPSPEHARPQHTASTDKADLESSSGEITQIANNGQLRDKAKETRREQPAGFFFAVMIHRP
jgi:hypothetical protein